MQRARFSIIFFVSFLVLAGCVANTPSPSTPPAGNDSPTVTDNSSNALVGPGDPLTVCSQTAEKESKDCFESAFKDCSRATGIFWQTSDNFPLSLESQGPDPDSGECKVRITVPLDSESTFAGQSANCLIAKTLIPASDGSPSANSTMAFDIYEIGPSNCIGTYTGAITQTVE